MKKGYESERDEQDTAEAPEEAPEINSPPPDYGPHNLKTGIIYNIEHLQVVCDKRGEELSNFLKKFGCRKKGQGYLLSQILIDKLSGNKNQSFKTGSEAGTKSRTMAKKERK